MKKIYTFFASLLLTTTIWAQSPEKMSYQAIIRNSDNNLVTNQQVGMKISILQGSAEGVAVYTESQTPNTNANGLISIEIGIETSFDAIDWADGPYFIKTETDPAGGTDYTITGVSQLLSVPYSLHAKTAETLTGEINITETDPNFTAWDKSSGITITESQVSDLRHFSNTDETDPVYTNSQAANITASDITNLSNLSGTNTGDQDLSPLATKIALGDSTAQVRSEIPDVTGFLTTETDPEFTSWDKSTGIIITESQISDLNHFTNSDESDPVFNASIASGITQTDTSNWNNKSEFDGDFASLYNAPNMANTTALKTVTLNSNDANSSFNVTKQNGTSVFGIDGAGKMTGDGSGLSNVKASVNYIGGNQGLQITSNYGSYQSVRQVTITAPTSGVCFVMATGYLDWESTGWDLFLAGILCDQDPNSSWNAENEWYSYLNIVTDYNCPDSSDQYTSFAQHRCIPVSAGEHTFYLWANKYASASKTEVGDVNMSVMFFPTGGTSTTSTKATAIKQDEAIIPESKTTRPKSVDGN